MKNPRRGAKVTLFSGTVFLREVAERGTTIMKEQHFKQCPSTITSRSWRYCPQSHRESRLPITMTVKPTAASPMEYGGS
jgi:hypothetical protein